MSAHVGCVAGPRRVAARGPGRVRRAPAARRSWPTRPRRDRRVAPPTPPPVAAADPLPVVLPRDDGPHDRLTEWWYYTGHLRAADGAPLRLRVRRSSAPSAVASRRRGRRTSRSPTRAATGSCTASGSRSAAGGPLAARRRRRADRLRPRRSTGADPSRPGDAPARPAWTMAGSDGTDHARGRLRARRGGAGRVARRARPRPRPRRRPSRAALHDHDGWIDFGPAGGSYYYSRTRDDRDGTLTLDGRDARASTASAWFDHQWGDFISVGGGGWDWFAVNLDDGTDLTLSLVRDADGTLPARLRDGRRAATGPSAISTATRSRSRSPTAGRARRPAPTTRPAGRSGSRARTSRSTCTPTVAAQELDTRATTGVVYWEGSQVVRATRGRDAARWRGLRRADRLRRCGRRSPRCRRRISP